MKDNLNVNSRDGENQNFKVTVDNTFNSIAWTNIEEQEIRRWKGHNGDSRLARWYNLKAGSESELKTN